MAFLEPLRQPLRRALCKFRGWRIDDGKDQGVRAGKRLLISKLVLAPGQVRGNQVIDVRVDREMTRNEKGGVGRRRQRDDKHKPSGARAEPNNADKNALQHCIILAPSPGQAKREPGSQKGRRFDFYDPG